MLTDGADLPVDLIHVAGINAWWRATPASVELSCRNAVNIAWTAGYAAIAVPLIDAAASLAAIRRALAPSTCADHAAITVRVVLV